MNSRSLTCVYPETRPDVLSYCGNCVEGVGQSPDQVVIVYPCVRGYTITHPVPKSGLFFTYNCGKFTPLRLQRWEYQNYENYLAICYPSGPGLHQFRGGGGIFLLPLMTNYGKFLTLQTATHKTHKTHKTHNCHVLIDTPLPYREIFSPVLIVFC